ncbi:heterogeneous nuclear ribonucleoprotein 1-like isoform X2 [Nymphaea colorata]|nr:heterogeneous nuclear ribonucleoprotein 1-like isoform X2 [Nymphaea colorata]
MDAPDQAKLFVGGISWDTNEETLRDHFKKYGDVVDSVIMRDRNTGSTRGFGFVLFSDSSASDKALQDKHVISGRTVEVKKAVPRGEQQNGVNRTNSNNNNSSNNNTNNNSSSVQFRTKKIFVGGLSSNLTEEEFKGYFEKFGKITDVVVMYDSATHRPRGFGFITFDSEEAVENVMQKSFHELNDKLVEVKRAVPKDGNLGNHQNSSGRMSGGRGGYLYSNNHAAGIYSPYGPRYGVFLGYAPPSPIPGYGNGRLGGYLSPVGGTFGGGGGGYGGGYAIGGYGGIPPQAAGYGAGFANGPPVGPPRSPWNGPGIVSPSRSPGPFGAPVYPYASTASPGYMNGGRFISTSAGFHDTRGAAPNSNGKWNHGSHDSKPTGGNSGNTVLASQPEGGKLDDHSSGYAGNNGSGGKLNQRGTDSRFRS